MRIGLYNGSTLYPLAGEDGVSERVHSSAADVVIQPSAALQVVEKVRAANALHLDRGNLAHSISFTTTRKFDSVDLAELWALDYDADFPRTGTLYLDTLTPGGFILRRQMADAVVSPPQRRLNGAMISLTYTVQGGAISGAGMLVSGAGSASYNALYVAAGILNGKPYYISDGPRYLYWSTYWRLGSDSSSSQLYRGDSGADPAAATPDLVEVWNLNGGSAPAPTVAEA